MAASSMDHDNQPSPSSSFTQLLRFKAGKMIVDGRTVKPDPRKGLVSIVRGEENLLHFQWRNRENSVDLDNCVLEDDYIVLPEEADFEKVQQAGGRVYILKFKDDDRKYFFWMQDPDGNVDADLCRLVNFYINQPLESDEEDNDEQLFEQVHNLQEGKSVGFTREANTDGQVPTPVQGSDKIEGPVKLADLQRILSNIGQSSLQSGLVPTLPHDTGPSLGDVLKPDVVIPIIESCHLAEELAPYLPEGCQTSEGIKELLQSPQFHQQVETFTQVLRSGQIDLTQFGLDPRKCDFTVLSFLEAIQDQVSSKTNTNISDPENTKASEGTEADRMDEGP